MARIGIQLMMLKDHIARDGVLPVLERVRDTGFTVVEVSKIPMTDQTVADMVRAREELSIEYAAISAKVTAPAGSDEYDLATGFDQHVAHARALGTDLIRIGMAPWEAFGSVEAFDAFAVEADEQAHRMADVGISLSYHHHHVEFHKVDSQPLLDRLRERAPHLRFEIDCHWVQRGGRDPERTLARYAGVLDRVHLKDYRVILPERERLDALASGDMAGFFEHWLGEMVQFAEVGQGSLEWAPVIDQAIDSGARHLLIEQDMTYGRDIFKSLAMSRTHLVDLGYEHLITGDER